VEIFMLGAFAGDFVGSRYEFFPIKSRDFELVSEICRPTDDTILTIAVGDALVTGRDLGETLRMFAQSFPTSYGMHFREWYFGRLGSFEPYGSWGNGAAMRVSTTAWLATSFSECMELAEKSAAVTHNHPEGIRGAKAVAAAIYAGISGWHRNEIKIFIERAFGYDLSQNLDDVMLSSRFDLKSSISVPKALMCAFNAETVEDAIRNAVYLGGDCDTEGAIAGSIAETWSTVPAEVMEAFWKHIPTSLRQRIQAIQDKIAETVREPLTREEADAVVPWDPKLVEEWDAAIKAAEEEANAEEIAAHQNEIERINAESDRRDGIIRHRKKVEEPLGFLARMKKIIFR
jgi:ADP-ribosylglycohydrolase